jgi:hypothetical protein
MNETKFDSVNLQNDIVSLLKETKIPVSVEFVATRLSLGWGTARAILLNLSVQGRVKMQKTTKSFIFSLKEEELPKHE